MELMPHVINASYVKDYLIKVKFDDGTQKVVDFTDYIGRGGIFSELREKEYFKRFFIDLNTVCWPNGADVAPERLYESGTPAERQKSDM